MIGLLELLDAFPSSFPSFLATTRLRWKDKQNIMWHRCCEADLKNTLATCCLAINKPVRPHILLCVFFPYSGLLPSLFFFLSLTVNCKIQQQMYSFVFRQWTVSPACHPDISRQENNPLVTYFACSTVRKLCTDTKWHLQPFCSFQTCGKSTKHWLSEQQPNVFERGCCCSVFYGFQ